MRRYDFAVTPIGKPRMTQRDKWAKRPAVLRYRAFCDAIRAEAARQDFHYPDEGARLIFYIPMPASWSEKRKREMDGGPCRQKPDKDNLEKSVLDALRPGDDEKCWHDAGKEKRWAREGSITIIT